MSVIQNFCIACGQQLTRPIISNAGVICSICGRQGLFRKQIIITGITQMNHGNICVSGVDLKTWRFVRPLFRAGLQRDFTLDGETQVISHFNLVEIEFKHYRPEQIHHTEDWIINENFAPKFIKHLSNQEIINVLNKMAISDLNQAIQPQDKSLFIVKAQRILQIWDEISFGQFKVRITFIDHSGHLHSGIPVKDLLTLCFIKYQKSVNNNNYSNELIRVFNANANRYIRIGLTRQFHGQYWKQVTALITVPDLFNGNSFSFYENKIGNQL
ncbi:MAG: hypothetical protein JZU64_14950 [Rhodoferax sp.]|nr:hypothetical protein [Rhodoferax sp.]